MRSFDEQLDYIHKLLEENRRWDQIRSALDQLNRLATGDSAKEQVTRDKQLEVIEILRERFEGAYEDLQNDIDAGQITSNDALSKREAVLRELAEFDSNALRERILAIRRYYTKRNRFQDIEDRVNKLVEAYRDAVTTGYDFEEAGKMYLDKAEKIIEDANAEYDDDLAFTRLFGKIKQAIRNADTSAIATNAIMGNYHEIYDDLMLKPVDYEYILYDSKGQTHGVKKRDEAIEWYVERARDFAAKKADEKLRGAQEAMTYNRPAKARFLIIEAKQLWQIHPKKKEELETYDREVIEPVLAKLNQARQLLIGIPYADLSNAFDDFEGARQLWPQFDDFMNDGEHSDNIVKVAHDHITGAIEQEFLHWEGQQTVFDEGHTLFHTISENDIVLLENALKWGGGAFRQRFGNLFDRLKRAYYRQDSEAKNMHRAAELARQYLQSGDVRLAHEAFVPYEKLVQDEQQSYPEVYRAWQDVQAYFNILGIKDQVEVMLNDGIDANQPDSELLRVKNLLQLAQNAIQVNAFEANRVGLNALIPELKSLMNLLEGLILQKDGNLAGAVQLWQQGISTSSRFFQYSQDRLRDVQNELQENALLNKALDDSELAWGRQDYRAVYHLLEPHQDSMNATRYTELANRLNETRNLLAEELKAEINDNINAELRDPAALAELARLLEEVNLVVYNVLRTTIDKNLALQEAFYYWDKARLGRELRRWRIAFDKWELIEDEQYQIEAAQVREDYLIILIEDMLAKANNVTAYNVETVRNDLTRSLEDYDRIKAYIEDKPYLSVLRARLLVRIAELNDEPQYVEDDLRVVMTEINTIHESEHRTEDYLALKDDHQNLSRIIQIVHRVRSELQPQKGITKWLVTYREWKKEFDNVTQAQLVGLSCWWQAFIAQCEAEQVHLIEQATEYWLTIEPNGKIALLTQRLPIDVDIDFADNTLRMLVDQVTQDNSGQSYTADHQEKVYVERLTQAVNALRLLAEIWELQGDDWGKAIVIVENADSYIQRLRSKDDTLKLIYDLLARVRERLTASKVSGDFTAIRQMLDPILLQSGQYAAYHDHTMVRQLLSDIGQVEKEYNRLKDIADRIGEAALKEDFPRALTLIPQLIGDRSVTDDYDAMHMVYYEDPFDSDAVIDDAQDLQECLEKKQEQIKILTDWLAPIVRAADLIEIVRQDLSQPVRPDIAMTAIVNFPDVMVQFIEPERANANYARAVQIVDQVQFGGVPDNTPPADYANGIFSLEQAREILQKVPYTNYNDLVSYTAKNVYNWAADLWQILDTFIKECEKLADVLMRSEDRFKQEREQFREIYEQLKQGRNRKENLCRLKACYQRIRGDGSGNLNGEREHNLYPLAHLWTGLDRNYKEFESDINRENCQ